MALLLGVVGIYGVIAYVVSQRRREIGIRAALGAEPGALQRMFVRHGLALAGLGVVVGLVAGRGIDAPDEDAVVRHHAARSRHLPCCAGSAGGRHGAGEADRKL